MPDVPDMFYKPSGAMPISMSLRGNFDLTAHSRGPAVRRKGVAGPASVCCNVPVISLFGPCYAPVISAAVSGERQRRTSIFSASWRAAVGWTPDSDKNRSTGRHMRGSAREGSAMRNLPPLGDFVAGRGPGAVCRCHQNPLFSFGGLTKVRNFLTSAFNGQHQ